MAPGVKARSVPTADGEPRRWNELSLRGIVGAMRRWPLLTVAAASCAPTVPHPEAVPPAAELPVPRPLHSPRIQRSPALPHRATEPVKTTPLDAWPELAALPQAEVGAFPTPLDAAPALAREVGLEALWIKRDDLAAEPYGGSKIRKLRWLLGAARASGGGTVHTVGGVGSHHALATAIYAPEVGLSSVLHLIPQRPGVDTRTTLFGAHAAGAELRLVGSVATARARAEAAGAVWLAPGGSSPLGNLGYVEAGLEFAKQMGDQPADVVYVAMGTMGTAVGLAIGLQLAGCPTRVVAVRASNVPTSTPRKLRRMYQDTIAFLRRTAPGFPNLSFADAKLELQGRFLGRGYALPSHEGRAAGRLAATHGLHLDGTYTEKAFAALIADAKQSEGLRAVFWQTHDPGFEAEGNRRDLPPALQSYAR